MNEKNNDRYGRCNLSGNAETKLLFTAYHNKNISDKQLEKEEIIRVNNWKEIEKMLM